MLHHQTVAYLQHSGRDKMVSRARKTLIGKNVTTNRKESRHIRNPNIISWSKHTQQITSHSTAVLNTLHRHTGHLHCGTVVVKQKQYFTVEGNYLSYSTKCWLSIICDRAYENRPCERKLHWVIFLLISFVPNALSHFRKLQKKAH